MYTTLEMSRKAPSISLSESEHETLDAWKRSRSLPYRQVIRAQIITRAADGEESKDIAKALEVSRPTVQLWRQRFLALRLEGLLKEAPRPGRNPRLSEEKIKQVVEATLSSTPANPTHWSTRSMAREQKLS